MLALLFSQLIDQHHSLFLVSGNVSTLCLETIYDAAASPLEVEFRKGNVQERSIYLCIYYICPVPFFLHGS